MDWILSITLAASQMAYYEARTTTYACNSVEELEQLRNVRAASAIFNRDLFQMKLYGQCIIIPKGMVVEGSAENAEKRVLRINERLNPPGAEAPLEDFVVKETSEQQ